MRKKRLTALFLVLFTALINIQCVFAEPDEDIFYLENDLLTAPDTSHAESAVLMDLTSGR